MKLRALALIASLAATTPAFAQDACAALAGASLIAEDGTYLGKVASQYVSESIFNEYETYGSKYSAKSIWNEYGKYGGAYSTQSPFNAYSSTPPTIVKGGEVLAYLTVNRTQRGAVNPYALKSCEF